MANKPIRYAVRMGKAAEDMTGRKFGRLTVVRRVGTDRFRNPVWECACECGATHQAIGAHLRAGKIVSCGCASTERARMLGRARHKGDSVGYSTAHDRLRRHRGPASGHACVDCGEPAKQWSLRHDSAKRATGRTQHCAEMAWSPDVNDYEPRCVGCHKAYDGMVRLVQ